jgi:hypothetical protein
MTVEFAMPHLIQWIFRQPKWKNRRPILFCRIIEPKLCKEIEQTLDDARAQDLLGKLIGKVNASRAWPDQILAEYVIRLLAISDLANRRIRRNDNNRFSRSRNYA